MLDEPPDADPHVRWCERRALVPPSYSIIAPYYYIQIIIILICNIRENNRRIYVRYDLAAEDITLDMSGRGEGRGA